MDAAGIHGAELARRCGVGRGTVSHWLTGRAQPTHDTLARIVLACGMTMSQFWAVRLRAAG